MACGGFLRRSEPPEIFIVAPEEQAELGEEPRAAWEVGDWDTPDVRVRHRRWRTLGRANCFRLDRPPRPLSEVLANRRFRLEDVDALLKEQQLGPGKRTTKSKRR